MKEAAVRITTFRYVLAFYMIMAFPGSALACGWWGDGEMNRDSNEIAADSWLVGETAASAIPAGVEATRLPGDAGYGIAVFLPDMAIPYLRATNGHRITRIGQLKNAGFVAVIDLGTPAATARQHRSETEALGMRYVSIPVSDDIPTPAQVALFTATIGDSANRPLVVFAHESGLLGNMWVLHRMGRGALRGTAFGEGMAFGTSDELEEYLASRLP